MIVVAAVAVRADDIDDYVKGQMQKLQVSGKPWSEFLAERVFAPLKMTATRVTSVADIVPTRADGYAWKLDRFQNHGNWPTVRPSGAFLSTALDLAKWEAALITDAVLKGSTKTELWTRVILNDGRKYPYGFGWQLDDFPAGSSAPSGVPMIRHGGSLPGFRAGYFRWPSHGLTVVVLTNLEDAPIDGLGAGIAVRYAPELKQASLPPQAALHRGAGSAGRRSAVGGTARAPVARRP